MDEEGTTETEEHDPTEAIRIAIMVIGLALNLVVMWDFLKERPEMLVTRRRVRQWWERTFVHPEREAKRLRLAEGETVFEAIQIVEGTDNGRA